MGTTRPPCTRCGSRPYVAWKSCRPCLTQEERTKLTQRQLDWRRRNREVWREMNRRSRERVAARRRASAPPRPTSIERFWAHVEKTETCWLWHGANSGGYGRTKIDGVDWSAHRYTYTQEFGSIPEGMMVCHRCDVPACVRPDHLFLGTASDNMRDCSQKGRLFVRRIGTPRARQA